MSTKEVPIEKSSSWFHKCVTVIVLAVIVGYAIILNDKNIFLEKSMTEYRKELKDVKEEVEYLRKEKQSMETKIAGLTSNLKDDDSCLVKKSESDNKVDEIMQELQDTCINVKKHQTAEQLTSDTKDILNSITPYKEIIKMNQKVRNEIKWIIDESKGPDQVPKIIQLMKQDIRDICVEKATDCKELRKYYQRSGVYRIFTEKNISLEVYCDMVTDGGGWTVFQRRVDGKTDFQRDWASYKNGFGDLEKEFWLGNDKLSQLTKHGQYELRVDLEYFSGATVYAKYSSFKVQDESTKYKLTVNGYSGTSGDSLTNHKGLNFSTKDRDNDSWSSNCASDYCSGGWWYGQCAHSALNGLYGTHNSYSIYWDGWKDNQYNIKATSMMFRRLN